MKSFHTRLDKRRISMRSNRFWGLALLGLFLLSVPASNVGAQQAPAVTKPDPKVLLQQMCDYLKSLKQFSFHAEVAEDQVYSGGKKLQYGLDLETLVRRPDRLRVNAAGDLVNKQLFFNGKTITLYDKTNKVYGTMEVPSNIEGALDKVHKDFGLRVALTDLASPLLWDHVSKGLDHALYVGMAKVRGVPCHHLAFDRSDVQFQVWIDAGDQPLPRKVVFTQKKLEGSPEWSAVLSDWNSSTPLDDGLFNFVAPAGVQKIKFVPVQPTAAPGKKKGTKS
jgi:hypothetical protein